MQKHAKHAVSPQVSLLYIYMQIYAKICKYTKYVTLSICQFPKNAKIRTPTLLHQRNILDWERTTCCQ